jgi:hypothetical protein
MILSPGSGTDGLDYKAWFCCGWVPSNTGWLPFGGIPVSSPTLLPFRSYGTVNAFTVDQTFTPSILQYNPTGPSQSYGWTSAGSIGGTLSPW